MDVGNVCTVLLKSGMILHQKSYKKGSFYDSSVNLPVARSPQLQELPGPVNSIESCCLVSADRRSLRLRNS